MKKAKRFFGRRFELNILNEYTKKSSASLLVIRGRRRVGKTRLIEEFSHSFKTVYVFSGLAPDEKTTAQDQREEFARQLSRNMDLPLIKSDDWGDLFWMMAKQIPNEKTLVVLDEITWMGGKDPLFLSKFQNIWESYLKKNDKLIVILCGSVSSWIEENILKSTGFVGRISHDLFIKELPLDTCKEFWQNKYRHIAPYEIFKTLCITGGIPWYLEHINPKQTTKENIKRLAFVEGGILYKDFDSIFSDIFGKKNDLYIRIINTLLSSSATQTTILNKLELKKSGDISLYLNNLIEAGFITRDYTWSINTGKESKLSQYRLSDNYIRFYLRFILPNKSKIIRGNLRDISLNELDGWYSVLGLQFENLVLNNRHLIKKHLSLNPVDIVYDNPYFQTQTRTRKACQIDYLIKTKTNNLYIFEIKFQKDKVSKNIIEQMQNRIGKLETLKNHTIRPVLIHVNGVDNFLEKSDYFAKIIDFNRLIEIA